MEAAVWVEARATLGTERQDWRRLGCRQIGKAPKSREPSIDARVSACDRLVLGRALLVERVEPPGSGHTLELVPACVSECET
jgi:hypothetical protein